MKHILLILVLTTHLIRVTAQPIQYRGVKILFPSTVKGACERNKLGFKPPGFYYAQLADSVIMSLGYVYTMADFYNETQPASVLYDRQLTTYLFKFEDKTGRFEVEQKNLEMLIGRRLTLSNEEGSSSINYTSEKRKQMPVFGNFRLARGATKDGVFVFLREVPRLSYKQKPLLQVFFFKNIPPEEIEIRVHAMD
ncbi:hypothetical protein [Fibrella aquatilis]|uniref:Uncharacterized protein n=1 Tax=Fibrella aquatilis TaxID=2817059 RepID=A0A939G085_9BACT|nr:hypothetical protein [Fibrella aquatilis]MBO0929982.1 hypothetical protein [Fibrella aquatilis]